MFTKDTFRFLDDLAANNNREWFTVNKARYVREVQQPALEFIRAMKPLIGRIAPVLVASDSAVGGSLMRVYRDTRFAKDKTPYKTNVGIHFRHEVGKDVHAPGWYIHLAPDECFVGAGVWQPDAPALAKIRHAIDRDGKAWLKVRDDRKFREHFELWGESLRTAPRDFPRDHPLIDDLRRKDFIGLAPLRKPEVIGPGFARLAQERLKATRSLMTYLCRALGLPW
jgi:uncharacterized protein (TIGR02453 family)